MSLAILCGRMGVCGLGHNASGACGFTLKDSSREGEESVHGKSECTERGKLVLVIGEPLAIIYHLYCG